MKNLLFGVLILLLCRSGSLYAQETESVERATKAYTQAREAYSDATLQLKRASLREEKRAIVKEVASLTAELEKALWPVYDKYEAELVKLNDARLSLINNYANHYSEMTNEKAKELTAGVLDLMQKRVDLKKTYAQQLQGVIPAINAARLLQLENQLDLLIDLEIASQVPLIE